VVEARLLFTDLETFVTLLGGMLESVLVGRTEDDFPI
jgi:hypothetical protein